VSQVVCVALHQNLPQSYGALQYSTRPT